jgi:hypothetical protein
VPDACPISYPLNFTSQISTIEEILMDKWGEWMAKRPKHQQERNELFGANPEREKVPIFGTAFTCCCCGCCHSNGAEKKWRRGRGTGQMMRE